MTRMSLVASAVEKPMPQRPPAPPSPAAAEPRRRADEPPNRRRAILLAAERLFAEHGFHAVSVRDIASAAGVPLALVGYHYGNKQALYHAIFESWMPVIEERRRRLAKAMAASPTPRTLDEVLEAFVAPLVAMHADPEGMYFARMATRDLAAPSPESEQAHREFFDPMAHDFIDALQHLFPTASRADVAWCYQFMLGAVLHFLSDQRVERLSHGEATPADPARTTTLVAFVAAGFRGVLTPAPVPAAVPAVRSRKPRPTP